jgi:hypothetical protein
MYNSHKPSAYHPENSDHACIDFYEVEIKTMQKQIYPNLPATEMTAYDGESPGPMFLMEQGRGEYLLSPGVGACC